MMRSLSRTAAALVFVLTVPSAVSAEIVFLASGRTLSVKGHRAEGDSVVLMLRDGGELRCSPEMVLRIEPDEYIHPDPPRAPAPSALDGTLLDDRYGRLIEESAARHGVDPKLVRAVIQVESGYKERAISPKGAMGLMQLMPETARRLAVADPYDPGANIDAGIRHLKALLDRFKVSLALAAYNAGEAAVERFNGIPPYVETRNYVRDVMRLAGLAPAEPR
jgi:soluble lytic murein transglycosylase-like protein